MASDDPRADISRMFPLYAKIDEILKAPEEEEIADWARAELPEDVRAAEEFVAAALEIAVQLGDRGGGAAGRRPTRLRNGVARAARGQKPPRRSRARKLAQRHRAERAFPMTQITALAIQTFQDLGDLDRFRKSTSDRDNSEHPRTNTQTVNLVPRSDEFFEFIGRPIIDTKSGFVYCPEK
jgi:hypothetical protein